MNKYGLVKVAAISPNTIEIGNPLKNAEIISNLIKKAREKDVEIMVFPELCITGYTCGDLFFQNSLIRDSIIALQNIASNVMDEIVFVGLPVKHENQLFNCAAVLNNKKVLAIIPKTHIPNYNEFYEMRYFSSSTKIKNNTTDLNNFPYRYSRIPTFTQDHYINLGGSPIYFGTNVLFKQNINEHEVIIGCEICEDAWVPIPPSAKHCLKGANIIVNLSASNETVSKKNYRHNLISMLSATNICGYVYSSASRDESTSDTVFSGHKMICENGSVLEESVFLDDKEIITAQIDVEKLNVDRMKSTSFMEVGIDDDYQIIVIKNTNFTEIERKVSLTPFVPKNINERAEEILNIQAAGLAQRLKKINCKKVVIGISGGLDSTLALLASVRAFDINGYDKSGIIGITMPGFGTSNGTLKNSLNLMECLGITPQTISIKDACIQHLKDIKHPDDLYDVTYENTQARERTQILMDVANKEGGIVIGTGDLSELALGWCTYNGDHMSMYAVNASIPKTLVRHLVKYYADIHKNEKVSECLYSILDTPVSPELLPPNKDGSIAQKTEESIGNYNIHDFTIYYALRFGFSPEKIFKLFMNSAKDDDSWKNIEPLFVLNNMKTFYKRFFSQQFKRNCVPDGIKVGSISLSPRADWRMPSDANGQIWIDEIENLISEIKK